MKQSAFDFKKDLRASLVVFLVALPLAMGVSIASGYPPAAGVITGIIGGILVGFLSGAPLQVSGAAAGLTVIVFQGVQEFGLEQMGLVVLAAGLMQVLAALIGLGRWFQAISPTVLHAMLAGIGMLIVAGQLHVMLDLAPIGGGLDNLAALPSALQNTFAADKAGNAYALLVGALAIAIMAFWPKFAKGKLKHLPAPLVAVIACSVLAWLGHFQVKYVAIPSDLAASIKLTPLSLSTLFDTPGLVALAFQLALIASAESLLCAGAVDQLHTGPRAKFNKELAAQGIGNALCGLVGALPMTGVIVRSSANLNAGATSRLSAILHGVWLLLFVWLLPSVLAFIPIASLAGILVFTGAKLLNLRQLNLLRRYGRSELVIYAVTFSVIVGHDLLLGVVLGLVLASLKLLRQLTHLSISVRPENAPGKRFVVQLKGAATFLRLPKLVSALEKIPGGAHVEFNTHIQLMDSACIEHLTAWYQRHMQTGGRIDLKGKRPGWWPLEMA